MDKLGPFELNRIYTGDARELAKQIPDKSTNLIFTDPEYEQRIMYKWLAHIATRILLDTGLLLVWSNGKWHKRHTDWLEAEGLSYRWTFTCINLDKNAPMNGKIIAKANRILWFDLAGNSKMFGYLPDGYTAYSSQTSLPRLSHRWYKSPKYTGMCIEAFTEPNDIVIDFFSGSGTIPGMAFQLQRYFLAFELDPEMSIRAQHRIQNAQMSLFLTRNLHNKPLDLTQQTLWPADDKETIE